LGENLILTQHLNKTQATCAYNLDIGSTINKQMVNMTQQLNMRTY